MHNIISVELATSIRIHDFEMEDAIKADGAFKGQEVLVPSLIGKLRLHVQGYVDKEDFFISLLKGKQKACSVVKIKATAQAVFSKASISSLNAAPYSVDSPSCKVSLNQKLSLKHPFYGQRLYLQASVTRAYSRSQKGIRVKVVAFPTELEVATEPPINLYKPKEPYTARIVSVERLVGPKAPGETCHIVIDHGGNLHIGRVRAME
ncbi:hypothetical protein L7F22_033102 [Adiantum nelumboides]|nr:hypothetical protein [Adiantum nelumboides]